MSKTTIHAAKTNLSKLIAQAEAGEEVVILRDTTPVARLVGFATPPRGRQFGGLAGIDPRLRRVAPFWLLS